jgi:hypothetical protein
MVPLMSNLLASLVLLSLLSGCVSSRIEQSRDSTTGIESGEAIVLLGRASYNDKQTEESFTECIAEVLGEGDNPIRLIGQSQFRDDLYPWFEPRTAPTSADELGRLFAEPGVKDRIASVNVRYLAWIDGDTVTIDSGGSMSCTISTFGGGCFGMSYWEEDASYEAAIWDLKTMTSTGQISADANGTSYLAGLIIPVPILARPGNAACKGLANQLRAFIVGES